MQRFKRFTYEGFRITVGTSYDDNNNCMYVEVPMYIECPIPLVTAMEGFRKLVIKEMGLYCQNNITCFKSAVCTLDYPETFCKTIKKGSTYIMLEYTIFFDKVVYFPTRALELELVGQRLIELAVVYGQFDSEGSKSKKVR